MPPLVVIITSVLKPEPLFTLELCGPILLIAIPLNLLRNGVFVGEVPDLLPLVLSVLPWLVIWLGVYGPVMESPRTIDGCCQLLPVHDLFRRTQRLQLWLHQHRPCV